MIITTPAVAYDDHEGPFWSVGIDTTMISRRDAVRPRLALRRVMSSMFTPGSAILTRRAASYAGGTIIVAFGLEPAVADACQHVAADVGVGFVEVRHLHAACRALATHAGGALVASTTLRPWDRAVVAEKAEVAGVRVRWVSPDEDADEIASALRVTVMSRPQTKVRGGTPSRTS